MRIALLGEFEVRRGADLVPIRGTKVRAVLAMLASQPGRLVPASTLIDGLWERPPPSASNALQVFVSRLRKTLEVPGGGAPDDARVVRRPHGYSLEIDPSDIDARRFEELIDEGLALVPITAIRAAALLRDALSLWRGAPLAEFANEPFADAEVRRLQDRRRVAVEGRIDVDLALGRHPLLIHELEEIIAGDPLNEGIAARLMLAYYRCSRQADALSTYRLLRSRLADELGLDPSRQLQDLERAVLAQEHSLDAPPLSAWSDQAISTVGSDPLVPQVWNVPPRHPRFVGRGDLLDRIHDLTAGAEKLAVVSLYGLGGVGKTQLAIEYAHRNASDYDVVWWIDAEQAVLIPAQLAVLAERLGVVPSPDVASVRPLLNALSRRTGWLMIFDNASRPEDIADYRPAGSGHLLVTSRYPGWGDIGERVEVDVLARSDTISLLRSRLPATIESDADALAEELGDLPLAAMQAAAYLEQSGMSAAEYLQLFSSHRAALLARGDVIGYQGRVDTAWAIALGRLRTESPAAVELLESAAVLAPDRIPIELLARIAGSRASDPLTDAVTAAVCYSLARRLHHEIVVHRLVQSVILHRMPGPKRRAVTTKVVEALAVSRLGDPNDPTTWSGYRSLAPHLLHLGAAGDDVASYRELLLAIVAFTNFSGDPRGSGRIAADLHRRWTDRLGPDHPDALAAAAALTSAMTWFGEHEAARTLGQDTLTRSRRVLGADHPTTLRAATNLTFALAWLGEGSSATELGQANLDRSRRVFGSDSPESLRLAANLALAMVMQGRAQAALEIAQDTLTRAERVLGPMHPVTLVSAAHLAMAHAWLGDEDADRAVGEATYARASFALGPYHPTTLAAAAHLSFTLLRLDQLDLARSLASETFDRARRILGPDHLLSLIAGAIYALALAADGSVDRALELSAELLGKSCSALGEDHLISLTAATARVAALDKAGRGSEARTLAGNTRARLTRTLGASHTLTRAMDDLLSGDSPPGTEMR